MNDETSVTLPPSTAWVDAVGSDGRDSIVPSWQMRSSEFYGRCITAWDNGVEIDGSLYEHSEVDCIEADALALLAAVHRHREFAKAERSKEDE